MKGNTLNMTQGSPTRLLLRFAIPMLIGNIFQQFYSLADSVIVGQFLGANALASVGATGAVTYLFFSVCNGISAGTGVVTSQAFGAGDPAGTRKAIANAAYIMLASSLVMGVISFLAAPSVLALMGTPAEILPDATLYMRMSCIGLPLVAVYNYASAMLRALGDSRTPLYFLVVSCILNILLDILCVYNLGMGIFGAALATIIAQGISGMGCLLYALHTNSYFRLTKADLQPDWKIIGKAVRLGLPMALQWSLISVSTTIQQTFVNSFGTQAMAAFTTTSRIEGLVHLPYGSISAALATYAGQNYGAGNIKRVRESLKHGLALAGAFTAVVMVVYLTFAEGIISLFVKEAEVIALGSRALRLTSWFYVFLAVIYMCRGILNGVGDALFAFINGVVEIIARVGALVVLTGIPAVGMWSVWWTTGITWFLSAVTCLMRYLAWRRHTLNRAG